MFASMGLLLYLTRNRNLNIAIVRLPDSAYSDRHPTPQDIFWLVEVAQTNLEQDLEVKSAIYATAAIQEYWVLDLSAKRVSMLKSIALRKA